MPIDSRKGNAYLRKSRLNFAQKRFFQKCVNYSFKKNSQKLHSMYFQISFSEWSFTMPILFMTLVWLWFEKDTWAKSSLKVEHKSDKNMLIFPVEEGVGISHKRLRVRPKYFTVVSLVPSCACMKNLGEIGEMACEASCMVLHGA